MTIIAGLELEPNNQEFKQLQKEILQELEDNNALPRSHPERKGFESLVDWLNKGGADTSKLKLKFYSENHRGVHAAVDIKEGESVLFVPRMNMITV